MRFSIFAVLAMPLVAVLLLCSTVSTPAASIKERMQQRLPAIIALKDNGVIGENAQGYLEYRSNQKPEQQMVEEENNDRRQVYGQIAKQQRVDMNLVGQRRAKQIAEIGAPGHWFRKADGTWYKK